MLDSGKCYREQKARQGELTVSNLDEIYLQNTL